MTQPESNPEFTAEQMAVMVAREAERKRQIAEREARITTVQYVKCWRSLASLLLYVRNKIEQLCLRTHLLQRSVLASISVCI